MCTTWAESSRWVEGHKLIQVTKTGIPRLKDRGMHAGGRAWKNDRRDRAWCRCLFVDTVVALGWRHTCWGSRVPGRLQPKPCVQQLQCACVQTLLLLPCGVRRWCANGHNPPIAPCCCCLVTGAHEPEDHPAAGPVSCYCMLQCVEALSLMLRCLTISLTISCCLLDSLPAGADQPEGHPAAGPVSC
jgi:hypothetical protein